ncbi:hypothetical protein [Mangrovicoccus sp. HB161399]|uniref:hypothetical protein n=1 Tax=Mangrovicoccus sp. HB161399 TaxID=2720392 RepID=UPI001556A96C|nr:hypothetical protein [Mangrovicoccus sp. HB161399]
MTEQPTSFIDCRGLSAPLTVLRIKQAMVGRSDCGLPLDVLVDRSCGDAARVSACLTGESTDIRLIEAVPGMPAMAALAGAPQGAGATGRYSGRLHV